MDFDIQSVDREAEAGVQARIDDKTKPPGALGKLERLALQIALIQDSPRLQVVNPTMLVFAGDHGISQHSVSIAPSDVTTQMVANFLAGGAAINCFCQSVEMGMKVIDAGIKKPLDGSSDLINQRLGSGTADFSETQAMSQAVAEQGIQYGAKQVSVLAQEGCNTVGFGEMGIGNTSSAAAIMSAVLNIPADECVGRGTGINDQQLKTKRQLIDKAIVLHKNQLNTPLGILAAVGGFEIAQIVGGILQAAQEKMLVLIDGFIVSAAALLAVRMYPAVRDYLVFCHQSGERGHQRILSEFNAAPLLNLEMSLGEGTGAVLALPLVKASCKFYNDMASFSEAGVVI